MLCELLFLVGFNGGFRTVSITESGIRGVLNLVFIYNCVWHKVKTAMI